MGAGRGAVGAWCSPCRGPIRGAAGAYANRGGQNRMAAVRLGRRRWAWGRRTPGIPENCPASGVGWGALRLSGKHRSRLVLRGRLLERWPVRANLPPADEAGEQQLCVSTDN